MLVLSLMRTIVLYTPGTLNSAWKDNMFLLSTILTLQHTWIHVCSTNSGNIASNIKAPVNESFSFVTTLNVPDIQPDNNYIRLQRYSQSSLSQSNHLCSLILFITATASTYHRYFHGHRCCLKIPLYSYKKMLPVIVCLNSWILYLFSLIWFLFFFVFLFYYFLNNKEAHNITPYI